MRPVFQLAISQDWIWREVVEEAKRTGQRVLCDVGGVLYWAEPGKTARELADDAQAFIDMGH